MACSTSLSCVTKGLRNVNKLDSIGTVVLLAQFSFLSSWLHFVMLVLWLVME
jgi:hypothetical protein